MKSSSHTSHDLPRVLVLARHGKAVPRESGLTDFERGLTRSGFSESARVAEMLQATGLCVDHLLSSPADRALETAHVFATYLDIPRRRIQVIPALYEAHAARSLERLFKSLDDRWRVVLACGHNPLWDDLAAHFLPHVTGSMQKSEALGMGFACASWTELAAGQGRPLFRLLPGPDPRPPSPTSKATGTPSVPRPTRVGRMR